MEPEWISLHRDFLAEEVWQRSTFEQKSILINILLMASHKTENIWWQGRWHKLKPGQYATKIKDLAEQAGVTKQNVRTALKHFEKCRFLTLQSTQAECLISVVDWGHYKGANIPTQPHQSPNTMVLKPKKRIARLSLMAAIMLVVAFCGVFLITYPSRGRQIYSNMSDTLVENILVYAHAGHSLVLRTPDVIEIDYTLEMQTYQGNYEELEVEEAEEAPHIYEYLGYEKFPEEIIGLGILTIERIALQLPIAKGVAYDTLRIAPGHVTQTVPIGAVGNAVIAGHRNYSHGSMFNRLGELELGDMIDYQARNGEIMRFEVFEIAVIEPEDQIAFIQPVNESIITLFTCTPIREATHRLIIRARRVLEGEI